MLAALRLASVPLGAAAGGALGIGLWDLNDVGSFLCFIAVFYVLLALGPWLSLRAKWWWTGSLAGAAIGLPMALLFAFGTMVCIGGTCGPPKLSHPLLFVFAIVGGCLGVSQMWAFRAPASRWIWVSGSLLAGAILGISLEMFAGSWPDDSLPQNIWGGGIAGAMWGVTIAATTLVVASVRERRPDPEKERA